MFPAIDRLRGATGSMQVNIEQHRACAPGLDRLRMYAAETDPGEYDAEIVKGMIDDFRPVLQRHLTDEVEMLLESEKDCDSAALLSCGGSPRRLQAADQISWTRSCL
jgi:hypothetical protein